MGANGHKVLKVKLKVSYTLLMILTLPHLAFVFLAQTISFCMDNLKGLGRFPDITMERYLGCLVVTNGLMVAGRMDIL